ncbi:helix-turn-helix domain-containing protein [Streptomyces sp. 3MP-14]|uniref:Helix-turn-helix domain-containing protein n=1 Tax=Streptomyces mimosae TaxID=2586635 RepID=A0A5N6A4D9_9ACTN|nr:MULTISPECIES: helix-turn-helix transcriptional regulator [Streptomyces]KAB8163305.1 helix-turn-helix domain-containing protein [Streptomyces mimosae]KAB8174582.1 helix-turn-helix domain-containing protein [Streptomyces sp. 3MP-14]
MYSERPAEGLPGAVLWRATPRPGTGPGRVLPDGCMDLILIGDRLVVAGPDTRAVVTDRSRGERCVGLRFAPGQAPSVLGVPANALVNTRVPLADVWPSRLVRELTERVALAERPGAVLTEVALGRLREAEPADDAGWRPAAVAALRAGRTVAETAHGLGLSERQLHRRSQAAFGYGPKTLTRVLRMGRALAAARGGVPLARVAAEAGYADQAHLSREFRALAGVPVSRLLAG